MTEPLVVALLVFIVTCAVLIAFLQDLLAVVVVFGAYSLGLAILWVVFRAPDVGLTEAAVGAGVTTALFLVVVVRATRQDESLFVRFDIGSLTAVGLLVAGLLLTVPALPAVGDSDAPAFDGPVTFYLTDAPARGLENVVTAVLVVYRGFDTFGEVIVVFAAGVAVLTILRAEVR